MPLAAGEVTQLLADVRSGRADAAPQLIPVSSGENVFRILAFMHTNRQRRLLLAGCLLCLCVRQTTVHGQTAGQIAGVVRDQTGAVIVGADVTIVRHTTGERRQIMTDAAGSYRASLLTPDTYQVVIAAGGFQTVQFRDVRVDVTGTTTIDAKMSPAMVAASVTVTVTAPLVRTDGPQLGGVVDSRAVSALPLATRNVTQLLALSPGAVTYLPDNTGVGRNTQTISVNGARMTQNNFEIDGVDVNTMGTSGAVTLPVPAPESIEQVKVQTSLYDATFGRAGGANVQVITKGGTNVFRGAVYEYFRHDALNADNPFLKAAGIERPMLRRHAFGGTLGGPVKQNKTSFFVAYQGTREANGASILNSISSNVLITPGLTDDRSDAALAALSSALGAGGAVHPVAAALLQARLPNDQFAIPTPQANGRYSGAAVSRFREDQLNANLDHRFGARNRLSTRVFIADTPSTLALPSFRGAGPNVPGFGFDQENNNRLVVVQDAHAFSASLFHEARIGYAANRNYIDPQEPVVDSQVGIRRSTAEMFPGLPLIRIAASAGGILIGTPTNITSAFPSVLTLADTLSIQRGQQTTRIGAELRYNRVTSTANNFARGQIDFQDFSRFLAGRSSQSVLGSGVGDRDQRAADYNIFVQDDWRATTQLTLNLGLRYELDLPPFEAAGRIATFDPSLYQPRLAVDASGRPIGPPIAGFVQAGNVSPQYDMPELPNVDRSVVKSVDANNLAPRLGFAYSPLESGQMVVRAGYGLFYSRSTFQYVSSSVTVPPTYVLGRQPNPPSLTDPFFVVPRLDQFPTFVATVPLSGIVLDRNIRTPYFHQYNVSIQRELAMKMVLEAAYVGTRGRNLFRQVAINQARLASAQSPVINDVTGEAVTSNAPSNAALRAPFQGVSINGFAQNQSTARSRYDSVQLSLTRRLTSGLQFLASYTFGKSIDNASGQGGGAGISGVVNPGGVGDTGAILGSQLDDRANRGPSDFDRTHRVVLSYVWDPGQPRFADGSTLWRLLLSDWRISGVMTAMSGLPIDIVDSGAGSLYGLDGASALARPSVSTSSGCAAAMRDVPAGFFFNPFAFARPTVLPGQPIPSSGGTATASEIGTDIGNVPRNCLRGPRQTNVDLAIARQFRISQSRNVELRVEFFNLLNHVNFANPISDLNAVESSGGSIDRSTGQITRPGDFGRVISTSSNSRLIQLVVKMNF